MDVDPESSIAIQIVLIVVLTLINAYFAASEMAIVSVNKSKIHRLSEEGNKKAKLVKKLLDQPTNFLSTIQVAITLAGFFNSASAATGISKSFADVLKNWSVPYADTIAVVLITILISFITLIFGELVPKRIALQKAESYSMFCAKPILVISKIASPFIKILSWSTKFILRIFGMADENVEESLSREEIRSMVESGQENGVFNEIETDMITNIFEFDDSLALNVMTPRTDVYCIDINDALSDNIDQMMTMQYTRIPVYDDSIDNIIGILNMKDFAIEARKVGFDNVDIKKLLRKPYFVLETKNIDDLFRELQKEHQHIAILVDEYGGFSGIITVEDLIEEIMGDIEDEYDHDDEPKLQKIDNNNYIVDGNYLLDDLDDELDLKLSNNNHDTIGGFVLHLLGEIPEENQQRTVKYENLTFLIISVKGNRVTKIKLTINEKEKEPDFSED
ncbi:hemolysin family protein [Thomasclavelia spiroformis]|uniref:Hemolysin family protein n=1 Tax=Thomasclavelia spiroformis TaxID=29348 RepID=A0A921KJG5_9FIRM|nr:hemolysin family protein [Thomasclavelia spiroformis]HJF40600.1 hemolysin family protein [Thomasclavelia spiroformis]